MTDECNLISRNIQPIRAVFFYPAIGIGGAQLLFARIAEEIAKDGIKIANIDRGTSFITDYFQKKSISFDHIVLGTQRFHTTENDILVLSLGHLFIFAQEVNPSLGTRIVFWDLHPFNLIEHTAFSFFYKKNKFLYSCKLFKWFDKKRISKIRTIARAANNKESLYFMCQKNFFYNKDFFCFDFRPNYIPIPIDLNSDDCGEKLTVNFNSKDINIGWLSRLDSDKVKVLNMLITDISKCSDSISNIILHVIGNGRSEEKIKKCLNVKIVFTGRLEGKNLDNYILNNIDLAFSMGTAVLEFAARGVPSVMVPSSSLIGYFEKKDKRYLPLYAASGYDVASEDYHHEENKLTTFDEIIALYQKSRTSFAVKSHEYVFINHDMTKIKRVFLDKFFNASLTFEYLLKLGLLSNSIMEKVTFFIKTRFKIIIT